MKYHVFGPAIDAVTVLENEVRAELRADTWDANDQRCISSFRRIIAALDKGITFVQCQKSVVRDGLLPFPEALLRLSLPLRAVFLVQRSSHFFICFQRLNCLLGGAKLASCMLIETKPVS
jgi:hypothetical protein